MFIHLPMLDIQAQFGAILERGTGLNSIKVIGLGPGLTQVIELQGLLRLSN